jgi:hypothetical protein
MAKRYKIVRRRLQMQLNEGALEQAAEFFKGAFHMKRGSDRQEEVEALKDIVRGNGNLLHLEDGSEIELTQEDAEDILGFLKFMDYSESFIDQMFKNKDGFNFVAKMAFGAGIFAQDEF